MLRIALWFVAASSALGAIWVLWSFGLERPRALLGASVWSVACGALALREGARARVRSSTTFSSEQRFLDATVKPGMPVDEAKRLLGGRFRYEGLMRGFTLTRGTVDVIGFAGDALAFDLLAKQGRVVKVRKIAMARKAGEPGATDNPEDAQ